MMNYSEILDEMQNTVLDKIDVKYVDELFKTYDNDDAEKASKIIRTEAEKVVEKFAKHTSKKDFCQFANFLMMRELENTLNTLNALRDEPGSLYTHYAVRMIVINTIERKNDKYKDAEMQR